MIHKLVTLAILSSCGQQPSCRLAETVNVFDALYACKDYEDVMLDAFKRFEATTDVRLHNPNNISGYNIHVKNMHSWEYYGERVSGETPCWDKAMEINNDRPAYGSMAHEMAHAMQNCQPREPYDPSDYWHSNWKEDGIYAAINFVATDF